MKPVSFVATVAPEWDIRSSPFSETLSLIHHDNSEHRLDHTVRYVAGKWIQSRGGSFDDFLGFIKRGRDINDERAVRYKKEWDSEHRFMKDATVMQIIQATNPSISLVDKQLSAHRWYHDINRPTSSHLRGGRSPRS
jgi:hypothetical protein